MIIAIQRLLLVVMAVTALATTATAEPFAEPPKQYSIVQVAQDSRACLSNNSSCITLAKGEKVVVLAWMIDDKPRRGQYCLRPLNRDKCYWAELRAIEIDGVPVPTIGMDQVPEEKPITAEDCKPLPQGIEGLKKTTMGQLQRHQKCLEMQAAAEALTHVGELQIQFQRWSVERGGILRALVSMKNLTDTDYATVMWSCEFRDSDGYKTGQGFAEFHGVPKNAIAVDSLSFYNNSGTAEIAIKCELAGTEKRSRENERLYRYGPQRNNLPLNSTGFWTDKAEPDGVARPEGNNKQATPPVAEPEKVGAPIAENGPPKDSMALHVGDTVKLRKNVLGCPTLDVRKALEDSIVFYVGNDEYAHVSSYAKENCDPLGVATTGSGRIVQKVGVSDTYRYPPLACVKFDDRPACLWTRLVELQPSSPN